MANAYEITVLPLEPDVRRDVDIRVLAFGSGPENALEKVKKYLEERNHFSTRCRCDFVVGLRELVE